MLAIVGAGASVFTTLIGIMLLFKHLTVPAGLFFLIALISSVVVLTAKNRQSPWTEIVAAALAISGLSLVGIGLEALLMPQLNKTLADNQWLNHGDMLFLQNVLLFGPVVLAIALTGTILVIRTGDRTVGKTAAIDPGLSVWEAMFGKRKPLDVEICRVGGRPVVLKHMDRYLHTLTIGTTGTGKTSRVIKPMIWQDLKAIAKGHKAGITLIEPKGDLADDVAAMCRFLKIPYVFINPEDPGTPRFNPMEGEAETVAEIMRTVLRSLFGKQEAFFQLNQEVAARNTTLLLKRLKGNEVTMTDMVNSLRDPSILKNYVETLERRDGASALTQFFRLEMFGKQGEDIHKHTLGLRMQLEDLTGNSLLERVLMGRSDINLARHLEEGGVLIVNTAMGKLSKLGDAFGQFVMMHFQNAVFSRSGTEHTRTPHMLYVDEFPRYVNPDFERLLAIGRSYRCASVLAIQATAQIVTDDDRMFRDKVLETCRNKIVLNLGSSEDARHFEKELGEVEVARHDKSFKYDGIPFAPLRWSGTRESRKNKPRFEYTSLKELPKFTAVTSIVRNGQPCRPVLGELSLSDFDLKHRRKKAKSLDGEIEVTLRATSQNRP